MKDAVRVHGGKGPSHNDRGLGRDPLEPGGQLPGRGVSRDGEKRNADNVGVFILHRLSQLLGSHLGMTGIEKSHLVSVLAEHGGKGLNAEWREGHNLGPASFAG